MSPNRLLCFCAAARYELVHHIDDCFIAYRCLLIKNDIVVNATTALGDTSTTAPNHISRWLRANTTFSILYLLTDHQAFKTHYTFIPTYAKLIPLTHHALLLVVSYLLVLGTERVSAGGGQSLSFPLSESTASTRTLCFMQVPSLAAPQRFYSEVCDVCEHTARTILHFFMWHVAEELLQQHLWCFEAHARGWLGDVRWARRAAATGPRRQALCATWPVEKQNNWGLMGLLQCKVILSR